jgi:type VI secretion system protein ImpK
MTRQAQPAPRSTPSRVVLSEGIEFSLIDEFAEGFQLLHMLHNGYRPDDRRRLVTEVGTLVATTRKRGLAAGLDPRSVDDAGYAFVAAIDEAVLASACTFRAEWESEPLQMTLFGDHLAGDHFFERLEQLRERGTSQLLVVEVFHRCLTLGFRGRYHLGGDDKLRYLLARLAEEIARARPDTGPLAPHWARPDSAQFELRRIVSPLVLAALLLSVGGAAWGMLRLTLNREVPAALAGHENLVQLPARVAHVSITLP